MTFSHPPSARCTSSRPIACRQPCTSPAAGCGQQLPLRRLARSWRFHGCIQSCQSATCVVVNHDATRVCFVHHDAWGTLNVSTLVANLAGCGPAAELYLPAASHRPACCRQQLLQVYVIAQRGAASYHCWPWTRGISSSPSPRHCSDSFWVAAQHQLIPACCLVVA